MNEEQRVFARYLTNIVGYMSIDPMIILNRVSDPVFNSLVNVLSGMVGALVSWDEDEILSYMTNQVTDKESTMQDIEEMGRMLSSPEGPQEFFRRVFNLED